MSKTLSLRNKDCLCRPLNENMDYTGDCPIHQAKITMSLESLKNSNHPDAQAILALIEQTVLEIIGTMDYEVSGNYSPNLSELHLRLRDLLSPEEETE